MSYYLLNHLSTEVLILVIVGVPTVAAVIAVVFLDRAVPKLRDLKHDALIAEYARPVGRT